MQDRMGLPQHISCVSLICGTPEPADTRLYAVVNPDSKRGTFDAEVVDTKGDRYLRLTGYRTVAIPNAMDAERLKVLHAALFPGLVAA
jgi:hypothetical protein